MGTVGGVLLGGWIVFWVLLYGLKALVTFCSWCDRRGWSLGTWDADDEGKVTGKVRLGAGGLAGMRKAKVALNLRPGSGLKPGK